MPDPVAEWSPYKGLLPYDEKDAPYFFGRDRERRQISAALRASRLTVLYGESGAGKSSVLAAGVACDLLDDPEYELVLFRTWRDDPMIGLRDAILARLSKRPGFQSNGNSKDPVELLHVWTDSTHRTLLLVLDQFEEYFDYHPSDGGRGTLAGELPRLLNHPDLPVNILLSMRGDSLSVLDRFKGTIPAIFENLVRVDHLTLKAAKDAVMKPLARFKDDLRDGKIKNNGNVRPIQIDETVAGQVVDEIVAVQGGERERVQAPYLQLVMTRWWQREAEDGSEKLQIGTLHGEKLGGVQKVVEGLLTETLKGLDPQEVQTVALVFREMVTATGRKQQQTVSDLIGNAEIERHISLAALSPLLERLVKARVLTSVPPPRGSAPEERCYEFGHDVLAKAALDWTRDFRQKQELAEAKQKEEEARQKEAQAKQNEEDARRQASRLKWLTVGLFALLVLAIAAIGYGIRQRVRINAYAWKLEQKTLDLQAAVKRAEVAERAAKDEAVHAREAAKTAQDRTRDALIAAERERIAQDSARREAANERVAEVAARDEAQKARKQEAIATQAQKDTETALTQAQHSEAMATVRELIANCMASQEADPEVSILIAAEAITASRTLQNVALPEAEDQLHRAILASHVKLTLHDHSGSVRSAAWSSDGKRLATASQDQTVKVWDADSGEELLTLHGHTNYVNSVAWSPDGKRLATGSVDKTAKVWDAASGQELLTLRGHDGAVGSVAWSPDGKRLATGSDDKTVKVWDAVSGQELQILRGHTGAVVNVAWGPDGKRLATGSGDTSAKVWDAASGHELLTLQGHDESVDGVAWSPDGKRLATAGEDDTAKVWDTASGHELLTLSGHSSSLYGIAWSADGERLATGSADETAKVWDATSGHELLTLRGHTGGVFGLAWSPNGKRLATGSGDETAKVWEVTSGYELLTLRRHTDSVNSVAWSPDNKRLATGSADKTAKVWDASSGHEILTLRGHSGPVDSVAWSPDGKRLATASSDTAHLWDADTGQELLTLHGHRDAVINVAWSPDGKRLATASDDKTAKVWDASSGQEILTLRGHKGSLISVAWSPDGKRLATGSADHTARVWDAASGEELLTLSGHSGYVFSVAWSPDGKRLATAASDGTGKVWEMPDGKELLTLRGHSNPLVVSVAWSADGKHLATGSGDQTAKVWDATSGQELLTLRGHTGYVFSVAWSPDGKRLATGSNDKTVQVYAMDIHDLMKLASERITAHPSDEGCKKYLHVDKCPPFPQLP